MERPDGWTDGPVDGRTEDGRDRIDVRVEGLTGLWMDRRAGGKCGREGRWKWIDGRRWGGRMDEQIDRREVDRLGRQTSCAVGSGSSAPGSASLVTVGHRGTPLAAVSNLPLILPRRLWSGPPRHRAQVPKVNR